MNIEAFCIILFSNYICILSTKKPHLFFRNDVQRNRPLREKDSRTKEKPDCF